MRSACHEKSSRFWLGGQKNKPVSCEFSNSVMNYLSLFNTVFKGVFFVNTVYDKCYNVPDSLDKK